jgi:hypothetical protein
METAHGNLAVITADSDIDITNGRVRVRLVFRDGGYVQEFHALDRDKRFRVIFTSLHKNLIPASEHRACAAPMISSDRPHLFGICRESLRMVYSSAEVVCHTEEKIIMRLTGSVMGHNLTYRIELRDSENSVHISVKDSIDRPGANSLVEYLMSSYAFQPAAWAITLGHEIDYTWVPLLRPADEQVIGDCAFYSPAAIIQHGRFAGALIPDLEMLSHNRPMQAALDLDVANGLLSSPLISYGFCGYEDDDGRCLHDMTMAKRLNRPVLKYGYELLLDANCEKKSVHRQVARLLWKRYGGGSAGASPAQLHLNDEPSGLQSALLEPDAWAAYGVYSIGDASLRRGAEAVVNALLAAPQSNGLFSTMFDRNRRRWAGCKIALDGAEYHTVECSRQAYWLLKWHTDIHQSQRTVDFCTHYGDFLISSANNNGAIPSWFDIDCAPLAALRQSAQTSASAHFLVSLAAVTGMEKYAQAAQRSIRYVLQNHAQNGAYQDYTLIDICNRRSTLSSDPHTAALPQSGWAMLWTAMSCIEMYDLTHDRKYVETGAAVLDQLCFLQSLWTSPSEQTPRTFGICAKGNTNWDADPELTSEFAYCAMRYASATGNREYFQRGAVALESVLNACGTNPLARARVTASDAAIRKSFGMAFVHVGKKWALPINGARIEHVEFGRSEISLSLSNEENYPSRIVFGGMRGSAYKLYINGRSITSSSDEMRCGLTI